MTWRYVVRVQAEALIGRSVSLQPVHGCAIWNQFPTQFVCSNSNTLLNIKFFKLVRICYEIVDSKSSLWIFSSAGPSGLQPTDCLLRSCWALGPSVMICETWFLTISGPRFCVAAATLLVSGLDHHVDVTDARISEPQQHQAALSARKTVLQSLYKRYHLFIAIRFRRCVWLDWPNPNRISVSN